MATSRSVVVTLSANISGFTAAMGKAAVQSAQVADRIQGADKALNGLSRGALVMGGVITAGLALAVNAAANFDQAMSAVAATGDDARANIDALRQTAIKLGADTMYSATEAANGIEEMGKAGMSAADIMGGGLKGALDLAAAGQMQVADAAELTATALNQFNLDGSQASHVADLLAAGAGKAQGDVRDMGMALKYAGIPASQLGISIEETTGAIAMFASQGIIGEQAGTSLRSMLMSLTAPTKLASKTMAKYGIDLYDTSGKFIGLTAAAQVLHDKLGPLDDKTRQAALGQMFGNEAIGAANVLMTQGASGMREWTTAVNDQGFAAEQAATKMNNLKGDLELLKGSLETALIGTGSGVQVSLRGMVQGVTGLIDKYNELPQAAQTAAFNIAAVGAAGLLAVGGITKMITSTASAITGIRDLTGLVKDLGIKAGTARSMLLNMSLAIGAVSAAYAVGTVVFERAIAAMGFMTAQADTTYAAVAHLGSGGADSMNQLNEAIRAQNFGGLQFMDGQIRTLTDSFRLYNAQATGWMQGFHAFTNSASDVLNAMGMKTTTTMRELEKTFAQMDTALSGLSATNAAYAFTQIAESAMAAGMSVDQVMSQFPQYKANVDLVAQALGVYGLTQQETFDWMRGNVPAAVAANAQALGLNVTEMQNLAAATSAAGKEMQTFASIQLSATNSTSAMYASLDRLKEVAASHQGVWSETNQSIDLTSKRGREASDALTAYAGSVLKAADDQKQAGASAGELAKTVQDGRDAFIAAATAMGVPTEAAKALADQYKMIPPLVTTDVKANGLETEAQRAKTYGLELMGVPKDVATTLVTKGFPEGSKEAQIFALKQAGVKPQVATELVTKGLDGSLQGLQQYVTTIDGIPIFTSTTVQAETDDAKMKLAMVQQLTWGIDKDYIIQFATQNYDLTEQQAVQLRDTLASMPKDLKTQISQMGAEDAKVAIDNYLQSQGMIPPAKTTSVTQQGAQQAQGQVDSLTGSINSVPNKTASVSESGASPAQGRVDSLTGAIGSVPNKTVNVSANTSGEPAVRSLRSSIESLYNKTVTVTTNLVSKVFGGNSGGGVPIEFPVSLAHAGARRFRDGGSGFTGWGAPGRDEIPAWIGRREYIHNDRAVGYYGLDIMEALNRRLIPREVFSAIGFRDGGSPAGSIPVAASAVLTARDIESAFRRALQAMDVVVVRRPDWSLMGGEI